MPQENTPAPGTPGGEDAATAGSRATAATMDKWIDELYTKYFDRSATDEEKANWHGTVPAQLETFLSAEAKKYNYTSEHFRELETESLDQAYQLIDADTSMTPEMKALAKETVRSYNGSLDVNVEDILSSFNTLKANVIDPYFQDLIRQKEGELKAAGQYAQQQRSLEVEKEQASATAAVQGKQAQLEASGLTFSGEAVKQLGGQAALSQGQVPFGGLFQSEGLVPMANRLTASSSSLRHAESIRQLGLAAEQQLGSGRIGSTLPGYNPMGGITGSLNTQQQQKYATTLDQLASNQQSKVGLNLNTTVTP